MGGVVQGNRALCRCRCEQFHHTFMQVVWVSAGGMGVGCMGAIDNIETFGDHPPSVTALRADPASATDHPSRVSG
ncbi:hypothetical protein GCM10009560_56890 [Nonomuraea longicatena]|uniref:Uncharacterized protein n=1 Tax=Nonomuraea longicatena TaxID=83682 RepID=A0ABN1QJA0_9ACTN